MASENTYLGFASGNKLEGEALRLYSVIRAAQRLGYDVQVIIDGQGIGATAVGVPMTGRCPNHPDEPYTDRAGFRYCVRCSDKGQGDIPLVWTPRYPAKEG